MRKRLAKESKQWQADLPAHWPPISYTPQYTVTCGPIVVITEGTLYPFAPPRVTVAGGDYTRFLYRISQHNDVCAFACAMLDYPVSGHALGTCACCNSILCAARWYPALRIRDILSEALFWRRFRSMLGWIAFVFRNDRWWLPDELLHHIAEVGTKK